MAIKTGRLLEKECPVHAAAVTEEQYAFLQQVPNLAEIFIVSELTVHQPNEKHPEGVGKNEKHPTICPRCSSVIEELVK